MSLARAHLNDPSARGLSKIRYRIYQLRRAIAGQISSAERADLVRRLRPAERALFERMPRFDQRHCLDVYQTLVACAHRDPALLTAALIHDTGKVDEQGHGIPLLYYGLFVILKRVAPALYTRAAAYGRGPLRPFATHSSHERRSAQLAEAAGCDAQVVAILRDYAEHRPTPAAAALAWADDRN
ncbi:hypothetical protein F8S13_18940 [Chloroflexia bacterium SDU3-3]|nr:hypothetical protein F8S13_18940 [Chloroflexia bacterium SDU3-3]